MEGHKTVLTACVTGTLTASDGKDPEAYKINVVYSDGTRSVLRKTYEEFVDLQGTVHELLKKKAGYSKKTAKTLLSSLPDLNSTLSRMRSKESDLKRMGRLDEFIKELFTLPPVVTESETVMAFFGAFVGQRGNADRFEDEEELKKINKMSESGRDSPRPSTFSPVPNRKAFDQQSLSWMPEKLNDETREEIYRRLKETNPAQTFSPIPGRRIVSSTDADLGSRSPRPGLRRRPFTVAANLSEMFEENKDVIAKFQGTERLQSPATTPVSSPRPGLKVRPVSDSFAIGDELDKMKMTEESPVASPRSPRQSTQLLSRSKESPPPENPRDGDSAGSGRKESRVRKISLQNGRRSPNKTKYVAVSSFRGEEKGEASLEEGEEFDVLQKENSGWWYIKNEFSEGWAPSAFLMPVQSSRPSSPETASQLQILESKEKTASEEQNVQEKQKAQSLTLNGRKGVRKISSEMNRRVKFLTVEGIQKRKNPDKNYVYILKVVWSDGTINIVYRQCSDFFYLQENLRKEFPTAIGKEIPVLKGKKFSENCRFCFKDGTCKRRQFMNQFCHELINAPDNISKSNAVMTFCKTRSSDLLPHGQSDKKDAKTSENNDENDDVQISGPVVFEQYIVVADYKKKNKNDISLTAGDTVDVIERNDYGWWLVDHEGELGWAPASHLEPVDDGSEITTSKTFPPGQEEVYESIQSYKAQSDDELSFDVGVMLKVVEKTLDGWWLVRFQGDEGWAPAMFLKKVADSTDSTLSAKGKLDELEIVSFDGDSEEDGKGMKRTPPTRRSKVQKSIKRKPKGIPLSSYQLNETPIPEEIDPIETPNKKNCRSISVPSKLSPSTSPRVSPRVSPRPKLKSKSSDLAPGDTTHQLLNRETSMSSGYGSSPAGSLTSLVSDVFPGAEENHVPLKKCATLPRFEDVADESAIHRSHSVTSFAQYKKEMEAGGIGSRSGKWSPTPAPRKISASRRSPLAGSPPKSQDVKVPPIELSSEMEYGSSPDPNDDAETPRGLSRSPSPKEKSESLFRALYPYISQVDGEITFNIGDVVEVVQRGHNGWWLLKSEKAGLGWGPSNYLESVAN